MLIVTSSQICLQGRSHHYHHHHHLNNHLHGLGHVGLFRPLEEYVGPFILSVSALCSVVSLVCVLKFSLEFLVSKSVRG
jgi:hypothetical protein